MIHKNKTGFPAKRLAAVSALVLALAMPGHAEGEKLQKYDIEAQQLSEALLEYSRQSEVNVIAPSSITRGRISRPVSGEMTPTEALSRLIEDESLSYKAQKDGSIVLVLAETKEAAGEEEKSFRMAQVDQADSGPVERRPAEPPVQEDETSEARVYDVVKVTAQRRAESIQDVPISITAVDDSALDAASIDTTSGLSNLVPGLVFTKTGPSGQPFLRGLGQTAAAAGLEPPVATYLDNVYLPASAATVLSLNNVDQIAVLKGPQGTLFGRNTTGGVVQINTRDPGDELAYSAELGYANYDTFRAKGYIEAPITDSVSTGLALYRLRQNDGWGRNATRNTDLYTRESFVAQSKTIAELGPNTELTFNFLYSDATDDAGNAPAILDGTVAVDGETTYLGEYIGTSPVDPKVDIEQNLEAVTLTHDFGFAELMVMGAHHHSSDATNITPGPIPFGSGLAVTLPNANESTSEMGELQLKSDDDSWLRWIVGYFYINTDTDSDLFVNVDETTLFRLFSFQELVSHAVYGEVSAELTSDLTLTLGARYTQDEKEFGGRQVSPDGDVLLTAQQAAAAGGFPLERTWKMPTYKAVLQYEPTNNLMLYGSYNRGVKGGVYNLSSLTNPPVNPEKVDSYEVGAKTNWFDNRLQLNVAAYYANYYDLQLRSTPSDQAVPIQFNAAEGEVKGLEVDFQGRVTDRFQVSGGFSAMDAEYASFPGAVCTQPVPGGGNVSVTCDLSGQSMQRAPDFTGNLSLQYRVPLEGKELMLAVNENYNSGFIWEPDGRVEQDPYHSISASATLNFDGGYFVRLWGANLADERIRNVVIQDDNDVFSPGAPRTFGITFGVKSF
ncbi:TonB-dependent receptor domain-containing protein [Henriciella aquimarina]|uniref:TonB-dependent receptor domain-containing protein n=1 Tax=Henriciella aquimarina TaxID=545261 RepID=UPI0009FDF2A4|nr:TonB-dependent receptor [Henriciella aquimarina]